MKATRRKESGRVEGVESRLAKRIQIALAITCALGVLVYWVLRWDTLRASPADSQDVSLAGEKISISYSSPSKRDRDLFGSLVPYGEVWRAGANAATVFKTDIDLSFDAETLPAGSYALFVVPTADRWLFVFNSESSQWGAFNYDPRKDVLQVAAPVAKSPNSTERLTFTFEKTGDAGDDTETVKMTLRWGDTYSEVAFTMAEEIELPLPPSHPVGPRLVLLSFLLLPLAWFAWNGLNRATQGRSLDDYLHLSGSATKSQYALSSVAYMLQLSTTFYFVFWGYHYGYANIGYLISWFAGLGLFYLSASRLHLYRKSRRTMLGFLTVDFPDWIRVALSLFVIVAFLSVVYVEVFMFSSFGLRVAFPSPPSDGVRLLVFLGVLALAMTYALKGGMAKVLATDQVQLQTAYLGFSMIFVYYFPRIVRRSGIWGLLLVGLVILIYFTLYRSALTSKKIAMPLRVASWSLVVGGAYSLSQLNFTDIISSSSLGIPGITSQVRERFGFLTLVGFTILNVFWQFCDSSAYQRLRTLKVSDELNVGRTEIRDGIARTVLVSPLTWGLGIVLGMVIAAAGVQVGRGETEYSSFVGELQLGFLSGDVLTILPLTGLGMALAAIVLSTVDSSIIAAMQVFALDSWRQNWFKLSYAGPFGIFAFFLVGGLGALHILVFRDVPILVVMAGAYSQLLVLSIPMLVRLLGKTLPSGFIFLGVLCGSVASWWGTFGSFDGGLAQISLVRPIYFAFLVSLGVYAFGIPFLRNAPTLSPASTLDR